MILEIIRLIVFIIKVIYIVIITLITYLYDYNNSLIKNLLENLNVYGTIENLEKYYDFKKKHTNGIALFTHTSYLDGLILAKELKEAPSFICLRKPLISYMYDIAKKWNCLIIEPKQNNSKVITSAVLDRNKNERLLLIAPTGSDMEQTDEFKLNEFKTGAFISLSPVLPILIVYNPHIYIEKKSSQIDGILDIIKNEKLNYKVKILDPIYPNKEDTIESYKSRVYNIMNNERKTIKIDNVKIEETNYSKKIFSIIIILILISILIFVPNYNYILYITLIIITFIIILLRNKNILINYLYKNLIYIYSILLIIYSSINKNYLLFINSLTYPFIYNFLSYFNK